MGKVLNRETQFGLTARILMIGVGALAAAALASAVLASSAGAAYTSQHPSDGSWATFDYDKFAVCDADADGHHAYAHVWQHNTPEWWTSGYDSYGRDAQGQFCAHWQVPFYHISAIQVCVQYEGCGPWKGVGYSRAMKLARR